MVSTARSNEWHLRLQCSFEKPETQQWNADTDDMPCQPMRRVSSTGAGDHDTYTTQLKAPVVTSNDIANVADKYGCGVGTTDSFDELPKLPKHRSSRRRRASIVGTYNPPTRTKSPQGAIDVNLGLSSASAHDAIPKVSKHRSSRRRRASIAHNYSASPTTVTKTPQVDAVNRYGYGDATPETDDVMPSQPTRRVSSTGAGDYDTYTAPLSTPDVTKNDISNVADKYGYGTGELDTHSELPKLSKHRSSRRRRASMVGTYNPPTRTKSPQGAIDVNGYGGLGSVSAHESTSKVSKHRSARRRRASIAHSYSSTPAPAARAPEDSVYIYGYGEGAPDAAYQRQESSQQDRFGLCNNASDNALSLPPMRRESTGPAPTVEDKYSNNASDNALSLPPMRRESTGPAPTVEDKYGNNASDNALSLPPMRRESTGPVSTVEDKYGYGEGAPDAAYSSKDKYGYGDGAPDSAASAAADKYGYGEGAPDSGASAPVDKYGYGDGAPDSAASSAADKYGYGDGAPDSATSAAVDKYGYGDGAPDSAASATVDKYGYGDGAPDSAASATVDKYGYGEGAPDSASSTAIDNNGYGNANPACPPRVQKSTRRRASLCPSSMNSSQSSNDSYHRSRKQRYGRRQSIGQSSTHQKKPERSDSSERWSNSCRQKIDPVPNSRFGGSENLIKNSTEEDNGTVKTVSSDLSSLSQHANYIRSMSNTFSISEVSSNGNIHTANTDHAPKMPARRSRQRRRASCF